MAKLIPLHGKHGEGKFAIVDDENYENFSRWAWHLRLCKSTFYVYRSFEGKRIHMHNEVIAVPEGMLPDHINRNTLDNRRSNFRLATPTQNIANREKSRTAKVSRYKGVLLYDKQRRIWQARIMTNGKALHLGLYTKEEAAAIAWNKKAIELYGEYACLNPVNHDSVDPEQFRVRRK